MQKYSNNIWGKSFHVSEKNIKQRISIGIQYATTGPDYAMDASGTMSFRIFNRKKCPVGKFTDLSKNETVLRSDLIFSRPWVLGNYEGINIAVSLHCPTGFRKCKSDLLFTQCF